MPRDPRFTAPYTPRGARTGAPASGDGYADARPRRGGRERGFGDGPRPGEPLPDFDLPTTDGKRLRKSDFLGRKPLLLACASLTCPRTRAARDVLRDLHAEFRGRVAFATVYVREARPGRRAPRPTSFEEKLALARRWRERDGVTWPVAVDSLDGELHRALGARPSSAYLMDRYGRVAQRVSWSGERAALRHGLEAVASGRGVERAEVARALAPALAAVGVLDEVLAESGADARRAARRSSPVTYGVARLARLFRPLPPAARTAAAAATVVLAAALGAAGTLALRRRARRPARRRARRRGA